MPAENNPSDLPSEVLLTFCKAAADSLRLNILRLLKNDSFGVLELCRILDTAQSGMSHHLKILSSAELLETRKEGTSIFYRRAILSTRGPLADFKKSFFHSIDRVQLDSDILIRKTQVYADRGRQSQDFFSRNADKLQENQDLIAAYSNYSDCLENLIDNEQIPAANRVMEIGPGGSPLLAKLSSSFQSILAVDNSSLMLEQTRCFARSHNLHNITYLESSIDELPTETRTDLIVMNMVLHHLPSPAASLETAGQLLNANGRLLLIDLCPHHQDWARATCGDLWLGFEPQDLDNWTANAKLRRGQSAFLGLRNGFQLQLRLFNKV